MTSDSASQVPKTRDELDGLNSRIPGQTVIEKLLGRPAIRSGTATSNPKPVPEVAGCEL